MFFVFFFFSCGVWFFFLLAYLLAVGVWYLSVLFQSFSPWSFKTSFGRKEHRAVETLALVREQQNGVCTLLHVLKNGDLSPEGLSSQT